jgi:hypothetical protein
MIARLAAAYAFAILLRIIEERTGRLVAVVRGLMKSIK